MPRGSKFCSGDKSLEDLKRCSFESSHRGVIGTETRWFRSLEDSKCCFESSRKGITGAEVRFRDDGDFEDGLRGGSVETLFSVR